MGRLSDSSYWSRAIEDLWQYRPISNQPMTAEQLTGFLTSVCNTLDGLVTSKDFESDLEIVKEQHSALINAQSEQGELPALGTKDFQRYFDEFIEYERALLIQSGMNEYQATDLIDEIRSINRKIKHFDQDVHGLRGRLEFAATLACQAAEMETKTAKEREEQEMRSKDLFTVIKGSAVVGIDSAIALAGSPTIFITAIVTPLSVGFGGSIIYKGLEKRF